ncbi:aldo/keto reductase family protein [Paenibacillus apiarius]|uniref:Aldo/keto reductase family protein n=1 Tax=Paenibacillus apiarius TaxID=46240 RepID=A0ABT4E197_9BACL|nr:aldo/keto reductase family protein [Paenibacillus apiarius]MCY9514945.1 aldo/keto reductase family protein [Paenibacillus apiarius]MCY9523361.1 aldo/keto reductase family protein [Paenibacillus apiarius]MCY9554189.1 aldo/keto reductase family protein [Paenibacillus apiarius]MCY9559401.1 aldo/keto reductase family protein [Paenibacillus apiarius]MCY9686826.1 aldo/keto reductase family protein [Paenibacillus apiarius]
MQYRRLGTCGLKVSEISLGSWLTYGGSIDQDQAEAIIDQAYELGINFFDTANVYHEGAAEEIVGKALAKYERSSYVLATKVYFEMGEGPNDRGLSRKHIIEQCEASLKRLGTDYIDLYQCHRYDSEAPLEETLRALDDLVTQGKVLYVGVSSWEANHIADAVHTARQCNLDRIVSNQPHYNMLDRSIEKDVLPLCEQEGIGQVVYCPLAQGVLTGKYKPGAPAPEGTRASDASTNMFMESFMQDHYLRKVKRLHSIADRNGISMPQLALAWILRYGIISSCIIGATRPEQVIENSKASGVKLSPEDLKEIELILKEET